MCTRVDTCINKHFSLKICLLNLTPPPPWKISGSAAVYLKLLVNVKGIRGWFEPLRFVKLGANLINMTYIWSTINASRTSEKTWYRGFCTINERLQIKIRSARKYCHYYQWRTANLDFCLRRLVVFGQDRSRIFIVPHLFYCFFWRLDLLQFSHRGRRARGAGHGTWYWFWTSPPSRDPSHSYLGSGAVITCMHSFIDSGFGDLPLAKIKIPLQNYCKTNWIKKSVFEDVRVENIRP